MREFRYDELMDGDARLDEDEILEGWHFCPDWDGLLIAPDQGFGYCSDEDGIECPYCGHDIDLELE